MRSLLWINIIVVTISLTMCNMEPVPTCGSNEEYTCQAPCFATCASLPKTCAGACVDACYCKSGYVRETSSSSSPCIELSKCPGATATNDSSSGDTESNDTESDDTESGDTDSENTESDTSESGECGKNEEFQSCGSACPQTCEDFAYPIPTQPNACVAVCVPGCFCKSGYYKDKKGKCVLPTECCNGPNEVFKKRGPAAVETCTIKPNAVATTTVSGCFCKSPKFVRKNKKRKSPCVLRSKCPKPN